jgi:N utilization substance protein B
LGRRSSFQEKTVARLSAIQALYKHETTDLSVDQVLQEFMTYHFPRQSHQAFSAPDPELFKTLVFGVLDLKEDIDALIKTHLPAEWSFGRLESLLRLILRVACFELLRQPNVNAKIILNEYVNLTAAYYGQKEITFVNGLLNGIARAQRSEDFEQA